jgi:23S rRNA (adenine2503-C2)-methyltransferase
MARQRSTMETGEDRRIALRRRPVLRRPPGTFIVPRMSREQALNLRNLDARETAAALAPLGVRPEVARRVFARVHRDWATSLAGVTGLGQAQLRAIDERAVWPELEVVERRRATDGFQKYLFRLGDRPAQIEAVRIPLPDPQDARALRERRRAGLVAGLQPLPTAKHTVCLSSQAGCALACDFCATGRLGAIRSLETWEILAQLHRVAAEAERPVRGVVFMGMGEPFLNYENVIRAARIMSDPAGPAISAKAISISTAGVVPAIRRFTAERHQFRLVCSLGAPTSEQRRLLMPIEKRWPLDELIPALRDHAAAAGGRLTLAYVAIGGAAGNCTPEHARQLAALLGGLRDKIKLNLIDVTDETGQYQPPGEPELAAFRATLNETLGVPVVRRYSGGKEIGAACGTLAASRTGGEVVPVERLVR